MVAAVLVLGAAGELRWPVVAGFAGGGALLAIIGFRDDCSDVPALWRLLGHFTAAVWVLAWMGGLPPVPINGFSLELGWVGHGLAAVAVVWFINLTNFMDGIDSLAAVEALTVAAGGVVLHLVATPQSTRWFVLLVFASVILGFLMWNWPPARIFMGDSGSGFLGLMLAAFALHAAWEAPILLWSWIILVGAFVVDATVTLARRVARGERFYEAHRSHAYQHAAHRWGSHRRIVLVVAAVNLLWLLPLAILVAIGWVIGPLAVMIAYLPLVGVAARLKAGKPATT